jgi:putative intracellular protease/amidase
MRISALFLALIFTLHTSAQQKKKILIVGTNVGVVNQKTNGTYLMEIAVPFDYFIQQGYDVDIVTPNGGKTAIYHKGDTLPLLKKMALNSVFIQKTANSSSPDKIKSSDYAAILFPGGYGHFYDVYENKNILAITSQIYESYGVIGSLGHGTADLLNVKLKSGDYLVKGKKMTCFPTWVEKEYMTEADYGKLLPVDMESELIKRGALVKARTKEMQGTKDDSFVTDAPNRVVTASFADGGEYVAKEMHALLSK